MMTACAAAYRATCGVTGHNNAGQITKKYIVHQMSWYKASITGRSIVHSSTVAGKM